MLAKAPVRLLKKVSSTRAATPSVMGSRPRLIGALEDAEDYQAFEAAIVADYDAQSAVERELVLRLASLLWRLRRATTMETGLFEIQADHLKEFRQARQALPGSRDIVHALFGRAHSVSYDRDVSLAMTNAKNLPSSGPKPVERALDTTADLARCFLRLANLPNFALDRLRRYEATLWRQAGQILFALDALDRRKPQERRRRYRHWGPTRKILRTALFLVFALALALAGQARASLSELLRPVRRC